MTTSSAPERPTLSAADERRFAYYFDEAVRLRALERDDDAYAMLAHCLAIDSCAPAALYEMAQIEFRLKRIDEGTRLVRRATLYAPGNYWYCSGLADVLLQRGQVVEAIDLLEEMTTRFPRKLDPLYILLSLYDRTDNTEGVIDVVNRMEQRMGKSEQLSMMKSRIYMEQHDYDRAFSEMEALVAEYPFDTRYRLALADAYLSAERETEAYDIYQQVLAEEPDNAAAMYSVALYYQRTGQTERYEQQVDSLLLNRKTDTETKANIARQLILRESRADGDSLRVIGVMDRVMAQEPDEADIPLMYAQYLVSKDMTDKAVPVLRLCLNLEPTNSTVRLALLSVAISDEDYAEIEALSRTGIELHPEMAEFHFYLAVCCNHDERWEEVITVCQHALDQLPADDTLPELLSDFYTMTGDACHALGRNTDAYAAYDRAIELYPDNYSAMNNYAYYLSLEQTDLDRAEEMSYKTIKAEPDNATYLDTYAWILFEKGRYTEARLYIDEAMKNNASLSLEIIEHCGDIYAQSGDTDAAVSYWQEAKELGSDSVTIDEKIRRRQYIPKP